MMRIKRSRSVHPPELRAFYRKNSYINLIVKVKVEMLKIGELAKQAGVTTRTLRYYEQLGLFVPSNVNTKGYRYYNDDTLAQITRIRNLQRVGLSLTEIKEVIGLYFRQKKKVEAKEKTLKYMQSHLDVLNGKIRLLNNVKSELKEQMQVTHDRLLQLKEKGRNNGGIKN
jgi:MerR family transcriptional regulator, copper efflux regulator